MLTLDPGSFDVPRAGRERIAAGLAAPGLALAGTAAGTLAGDACSPGLALPVSALALTVVGTVLALTGLSRERRDRIALVIAAGLALLSMAALQQLLACALGRDGIALVDLLQTGGMILLVVALALELLRRRRARAAAAAPPRRPVARERRRVGEPAPRTGRFAPAQTREDEPAALGRRR
jgi:hypothetical protein